MTRRCLEIFPSCFFFYLSIYLPTTHSLLLQASSIKLQNTLSWHPVEGPRLRWLLGWKSKVKKVSIYLSIYLSLYKFQILCHVIQSKSPGLDGCWIMDCKVKKISIYLSIYLSLYTFQILSHGIQSKGPGLDGCWIMDWKVK